MCFNVDRKSSRLKIRFIKSTDLQYFCALAVISGVRIEPVVVADATTASLKLFAPGCCGTEKRKIFLMGKVLPSFKNIDLIHFSVTNSLRRISLSSCSCSYGHFINFFLKFWSNI